MQACDAIYMYRYKSAFGASHLRFIVMNNLFATINPLHHRYDIKVTHPPSLPPSPLPPPPPPLPPATPSHHLLTPLRQGSSLGRASSQAERAKGSKCVKKVSMTCAARGAGGGLSVCFRTWTW